MARRTDTERRKLAELARTDMAGAMRQGKVTEATIVRWMAKFGIVRDPQTVPSQEIPAAAISDDQIIVTADGPKFVPGHVHTDGLTEIEDHHFAQALSVEIFGTSPQQFFAAEGEIAPQVGGINEDNLGILALTCAGYGVDYKNLQHAWGFEQFVF